MPDSGLEPHSPESAGSSPVTDAQSGTEGHRPQTPPAVSLAHGSPGTQNKLKLKQIPFIAEDIHEKMNHFLYIHLI